MMASGDITSGISDDNGELTHQPAAGVQVVVTWIDEIVGYQLVTGVIGSDGIKAVNSTSKEVLSPPKMLINNTNFLRLQAQGGGNRSGFTAIEL